MRQGEYYRGNEGLLEPVEDNINSEPDPLVIEQIMEEEKKRRKDKKQAEMEIGKEFIKINKSLESRLNKKEPDLFS
jgi:hypothetical protein